MQIGVGLPSGVPGASGKLILTWAREAEAGPFSSLGVIDRLVYDSYEPLTTLAVAAGATQRIKLATTIIASPLHNTTLLAKATASLDALSGGRLILGLAIGARQEDYLASGVNYHTRGSHLNEQLATLYAHWEDEYNGPRTHTPAGPPLLLGGLSDPVFSRVARYTSGYIHGGGPPRAFLRAADKARAAWSDAGRPGQPLLWGQAYFAFGDTAIEAGTAYLKEYYAFTGPFADRIAAGLLTTHQSIAQFIRGYAEAGCDELVMLPTYPALDQLTRLSEILQDLGFQQPSTAPSGSREEA